MSATTHNVFVYGTLRKGFGNHNRLLTGEGTAFVGEAVVRGAMYDLGPYPAVSLHGNSQVYGEIYKVTRDTLMALDRLEGTPDFYQRQKVTTSQGDAWIYVMDRDEDLALHRRIPGGDWRYRGAEE